MKKILAVELEFIKASGMLASVEIDVESMELAGMNSLDQILGDVVSQFRGKQLSASFYIYETVSYNFGTPCNSIFVAVKGSNKIFTKLLEACKAYPQIRAKFSDYIEARRSHLNYHFQDDHLWKPYDDSTWYCASQSNS